MRIVCPNCSATYDVADNAIPATGREVQCTNCEHAWHQEPALILSGAETAEKEIPAYFRSRRAERDQALDLGDATDDSKDFAAAIAASAGASAAAAATDDAQPDSDDDSDSDTIFDDKPSKEDRPDTGLSPEDEDDILSILRTEAAFSTKKRGEATNGALDNAFDGEPVDADADIDPDLKALSELDGVTVKVGDKADDIADAARDLKKDIDIPDLPGGELDSDIQSAIDRVKAETAAPKEAKSASRGDPNSPDFDPNSKEALRARAQAVLANLDLPLEALQDPNQPALKGTAKGAPASEEAAAAVGKAAAVNTGAGSVLDKVNPDNPHHPFIKYTDRFADKGADGVGEAKPWEVPLPPVAPKEPDVKAEAEIPNLEAKPKADDAEPTDRLASSRKKSRAVFTDVDQLGNALEEGAEKEAIRAEAERIAEEEAAGEDGKAVTIKGDGKSSSSLFWTGFWAACILVMIGTGVYYFAPNIKDSVPSLAGKIDGFVAQVDAFRVTLHNLYAEGGTPSLGNFANNVKSAIMGDG